MNQNIPRNSGTRNLCETFLTRIDKLKCFPSFDLFILLFRVVESVSKNRALKKVALESKSRRGSRGSYEVLSVRLPKKSNQVITFFQLRKKVQSYVLGSV